MGFLTHEVREPARPTMKELLAKDLRNTCVARVSGDEEKLRRLYTGMGWTREDALDYLFQPVWDFDTACRICDALGVRVQLTFAV